MFLIGGPVFSGTTLLALLLNQGSLVCLDEPDLHDPAQVHRGIPFLQELFPAAVLPVHPGRRLTYEEATGLIERCERAIRARVSGIIGHPLKGREVWSPDQVHSHMLKLDRHDLLKLGRISDSRVGVWRIARSELSAQTHETARLMGY